MIYLHGNASSRIEAVPVVKLLLPEDITVFSLDFSGSGKSEGEYISLGWYERDDVSTVVQYLRDSGKSSTIGLWGRSMGAVTALLHSNRDPSIAGIVCDSAFSDLKKLSNELAKKYTKMPNFVVSMGTKFIAKSVRDRAKFELDKVKPINHIKEAFIPALFGHATDDDFILPSHTETLHDAYAGEKNYVQFEGDHNTPRPQHFLDSVVIFFLNSLQVHTLVPQGKRDYSEKLQSIPSFNDEVGYAYNDDDEQLQYEGFQGEVTEEDMIRMAIEQSMKTHDSEKSNTGNNEEKEEAKAEDQENEFLMQAFSLDNDGKK